MSPNKRIFWNVLATYGRSLFALICGLFTARWVLGVLGDVNYGLFGVVGGLVVFITFLNSIFSTATTRFYAVAIGKSLVAEDKDSALEECRQWFNASLSIHTVVPVVLVLIGYPIGVWAVRNFLTIPPDRVETCVWVFRFSCLSCLIGMMNVPFGAMYRAKQLIAELTIYGYATTALNVIALYYMVSHPGDWFFGYAFWTFLVTVTPMVIIGCRAAIIFPECRIRKAYLWRIDRIRQMASFAGWELVGEMVQLANGQGISILINKFFGPAVNAARAIGMAVDAHSATLSAALFAAFQPAIVNAYGGGDEEKMMAYVMRACKFSGLLFLIFLVPLVLELEEILKLWLAVPPKYTAYFCLVSLGAHLFDSITNGCYTAFSARGMIREYQLNITRIAIGLLPCAMLIACFGGGVYGVGAALFVMVFARALFRVYYAGKFVRFPVKQWTFRILFPLLAVMATAGGLAVIPQWFLAPSPGRVCVTTVISEIIIFSFSWFFVLDGAERIFLKEKCRIFLLRRK